MHTELLIIIFRKESLGKATDESKKQERLFIP